MVSESALLGAHEVPGRRRTLPRLSSRRTLHIPYKVMGCSRLLLLIGATAAFELPKPAPGLGRRAAATGLAYCLPGFIATAHGSQLITAAVADDASADPKPKFKRLSPIQFIAALGDPGATSGTGAEQWGLWREDPGPRGVFLRDYEKKLASKGGTAPAGWSVDPSRFYVEEHGLIMEVPGPLPLAKYERDGGQMKLAAPLKRYVVTGDRDVTSVLTVYNDGKWELSKGSLYDVTHLPCRTGVYTASKGGSCAPTAEMQAKFPVKPGAKMPTFDGCNTQDWAVLFVVGVEA